MIYISIGENLGNEGFQRCNNRARTKYDNWKKVRDGKKRSEGLYGDVRTEGYGKGEGRGGRK